MAGGTGDKKLHLMLIGRTGEGKSATGNTILGRREFKESTDMTSETKNIKNDVTRVDNFVVKVVDCPGLMDTDMDSGEDKTAAARNMATALGMCDGGVAAFILVTKRERYTEEKRKSLEALEKIFGDRYMKNLIVVVSGGDKFEEDMEYHGRGNVSFKEWCSQQQGAFKKLFDDFSSRFLLINNREKDMQKKEAQRREIIQLASNLQTQNGRYTSKSFEEAKAARDKLIVQENLPMLNESLQMKVGLLSNDLLELKKSPSDKERERILQSLRDLKNEIIEKDKRTGLLNHLKAKVEQVENALHDVDKLHSLAREMKNIREERSSWLRFGMVTAGVTVAVDIGIIAALVTFAPVAAGAVAAGAAIYKTGTVLGLCESVRCGYKHIMLTKSEKQTGADMKTLDTKVTKAMQDIKK